MHRQNSAASGEDVPRRAAGVLTVIGIYQQRADGWLASEFQEPKIVFSIRNKIDMNQACGETLGIAEVIYALCTAPRSSRNIRSPVLVPSSGSEITEQPGHEYDGAGLSIRGADATGMVRHRN